MNLDLLQLRPDKLAGLLNSTPLGEVTNEPRVRRNVVRAGLRVGDSRRVNGIAYAAWLLTAWHARAHGQEDTLAATGYAVRKERERKRQAQLSASGRDIADMMHELPDVEDPKRRSRAERDFKRFCREYFQAAFTLPWSPDHLKVIAKIERAVKHGGLFAHAMPRGSGKTTLTEIASIWALLCGYRPFVCLIGATAERARSMLESIKTELECNELLLADFRREVFPIHALERIHNRANGQMYEGAPTRITWTIDKVVLPTIPGSKACGAIITVTGLEGGNIRGQKHKLADGTILRPSLVILDDPQTTESAWSVSQSRRREALLAGDVLGMAGPGEKIAAVCCCTVIRPDDMADNVLDRDKHPEWQGERTKMVYSFPSNEKLWDEYARIRTESLKADGDGSEATAFYRQHREQMDAGTVVAWPQRHNADEISGIQHAMNLKLRDEAAFFSEYQNEPLPEDEGDGDMLTADQIAAKTNGHKRGEVPIGCNHVTMFIDVQGKALFHTVVAWEDDFTGYLLDYGTYPDQKRRFFTLRDVKATLGRAAPGAGLEGSIYAGLEKLTGEYLSREWRRDDGAMLRIERCLIDANWGQSTDVVYQFCRQSPHSAVVMPSHGRYAGASSVPFSEYKRKRGDRVGHHWRIPNVQGRRQVRHLLVDTNYWKSFVHARLAVAIGDPGCLSLFGGTGLKPVATEHQLLAEHLTAEYRVRTEARGRIVDEWKLRAGRPDNHWLDCLVGCAVAASTLGTALTGMATVHERKRKRYTQKDLRRR